MRDDLKAFFLNPKPPRQRQYEALRAYVLDQAPARQTARRFGFTEKTLYALAHDLRTGKLDLFPKPSVGPKNRRLTRYVRDAICQMRKNNMAVTEIVQRLDEQDIARLSPSTVERALKDAGFGKLPRRAASKRSRSKNNTLLSSASKDLDFGDLDPFHVDCQIAGLFCFLPYLVESGIMEAIDSLPLPGSNCIGKQQAFLSFLALKLTGAERLSHVHQYDQDRGLGLFAGLNVLPKPTYMGTYSCLVSGEDCKQLQKSIVARARQWEPDLFCGKTINLDFHSIPHFGQQAQMENVWCGARNKSMTAANTFFAQDAETNALLYANADVLRKDAANEVLRFVEYLQDVKGVVDQTLVFDSRLTNYTVLAELAKAKIKFITLRRRAKSLKDHTETIEPNQWEKVKLKIPKREHQKFLAHQSEVFIKGCKEPLRQIIMKDHGRAEPTYVITNNRQIKLEDVLIIYARRWRIENKLSELVHFFNLNALSSPIMVRIHFDLLLSVVASLLYSRFARDLPRFEKHRAPEIFRRFIDMPGRVRYNGRDFEIRIRKRAHTPILLGVEKLRNPVQVPWLGGRQLRLVYTP
jgi:transposase